MANFLGLSIFSFLASAATLLGVFLVWRLTGWTKRNVNLLISLAAGFFLANAFLNLLPEAAELTSAWPLGVLAAMVLFYMIEHLIVVHSCWETDCRVHQLGKMGLVGIGFHSLVDGLVIGATFEAGFVFGVLASLAIILHKIADGIFTYSLLLHNRVFSSRRAWSLSFLVAAATPFGALMVFLFSARTPDAGMGWLLAMAGGSFIYIGASDLVPATHQKQSALNIVFFLVGVFFVLAVNLVARFSDGSLV